VAARLGDWVDQPIEVEFMAREDSVPPQTRYTLEGTDRGGILLGYVDEKDPNYEYRMLFFPWHRIRRIHLLTPIEEGLDDGS
jgi:hypothetical protein